MYNQPFNYNPYMQQQYNRPQQPIQQPQQIESPVMNGQRQLVSGLNGKVVESIDIVRNIEIPLDGSTSYFPTASGDAIVTKQLQMDGTSKIIVYEPKELKNEEVKFMTLDDVKKEIKNIDLSEIDDLRDEIKDIKQEIKNIKKKKKSDS